MCFHLIKVAECQPFYIYFLGFPLSILFMMPCFQKHSLANSDLYSSKCSPRRCCSLSSLPAKIILSNITVKRSTFLTDHAFEGSIFKPETWRRLSPSGSLTTTFLADFEKIDFLSWSEAGMKLKLFEELVISIDLEKWHFFLGGCAFCTFWTIQCHKIIKKSVVCHMLYLVWMYLS